MLKFISRFSKVSAARFLILISVLVMFCPSLLAQSFNVNEAPLGGGPVFGFSGGEVINKNAISSGPSVTIDANDGNESYRFGFSKSFFPDFDFSLAVNRYIMREIDYYSVSSGITYFPVRYYNKSMRALLAFHAEYEHSFESVKHKTKDINGVIESYQLRGSFFLGGHNNDRSSVLLPYVTYGTVNFSNATDKTQDVLGFGLIFGSKLWNNDTFFVISLGATYYNDNTLVGLRIGYSMEKDYITTNHLE